MKCSIQLGFASLNRTFNLSPNENIRAIALITIHYLYNIAQHLRKTMNVNHSLCYRLFEFNIDDTTKEIALIITNMTFKLKVE